MAKTYTPVKINKKERTIAISRSEYAAFLQWQKKMRAEIKDADEAITIAKNEKMSGTLKVAHSFSAILKPAR